RDRNLRNIGQEPDELVHLALAVDKVLEARIRPGVGAHRRYVATGAEPATSAREQHCTDIGIGRAAAKVRDRRLDHCVRKRVETFGPVQRERRDPILDLELQIVRVRRHDRAHTRSAKGTEAYADTKTQQCRRYRLYDCGWTS